MSLQQLVKMFEDTFHMDTWQEVDLEENDMYDVMPEMRGPEEKHFALFIEHLKKTAKFTDDKLRIYRALSLSDVGSFVKSLSKRRVGVSWTFDRNLAKAYRREHNGAVYILEGLVDPKEIDEDATVALAVQFSSSHGIEAEIRLAEGATVIIESITKNKKDSEPVIVKKEAIADSETIADIGSGGSGPNGYERIPEVDFDKNGMPEELEPYMEYPWSPKSKESLPEDAPEAPIVNDYSWPFPGERVRDLDYSLDEDRVNKNPNVKPQTFVRRAMETRSFQEGPQARPKVPGQKPAPQAPKAPPKVPGQKPEQQAPKAPPKKQASFPEFLVKLKQAFPVKEAFTNPPTYIWNPKEGKEAKLDIQSIKDSLKVKFPKLIWSSDYSGVETAEVDFPDFTYAILAIGLNANHLTCTYHIEGKG